MNTRQQIVLPFLLFSLLFAGCIRPAGGLAPEGYRLVWADEFNREGVPDTSNWKFERGFVRNEELQWYGPENAVCKDGLLLIEARRERRPNPLHEVGSADWRKRRPYIEYTSSCLRMPAHLSWQYGRFELRARIDTARGLWPAWWTMGVSGEWPSNGEIDIMEYYRGNLLANVACGTDIRWKAEWHDTTRSIASFGDPRWAQKFHVWRMDWDEDEIRLYVDDELLNRVLVKDVANKNGTGFNPFRQKHYMILNLAVGGSNGGDPSPTSFPRRFEIDYVRVYQKSP